MDHSDNDKRFCVYIHKNQDGEVVYVGSGTEERSKSLVDRSKAHKEIFGELIVEIVYKNLSKDLSITKESELYDIYKQSGKLLNIRRPCNKIPLIYEYLKQKFYYDETSPSCLRWCDTKSNKKSKFNKPAGYFDNKGYYRVRANGRNYSVHRIIWVLCSKEDLESNLAIDHIDRDKSNNKIGNLRLVTYSENNKNKSKYSNNTTGYTGIKRLIADGIFYWSVQWTELGVRKYKLFNPIKLFPSEEFEDAKDKTLELAYSFRISVVKSSL